MRPLLSSLASCVSKATLHAGTLVGTSRRARRHTVVVGIVKRDSAVVATCVLTTRPSETVGSEEKIQ